jgi:aconitate hydratase
MIQKPDIPDILRQGVDMGKNLIQKILEAHLVQGKLSPGKEIGIRIDQTLTQDATGTMAYLQFESMSIPRIQTELSVSYVDHNTLQEGFENADDHRYLQTVAEKYGILYSRPGMASATRSTLNGSAYRAEPSWGPILTHRTPAEQGCSQSGQGGWMWLWPWEGGRFI